MSAVALVGRYRAACAVVSLDESDAASLLTRNCTLDPAQPLTPAGSHPAIILLGSHHDVGFKALPLIRVNYREALVSIPWVRPSGGDAHGPFAHVSRLWLNRLLPVIGGWFFGFPKRWNPIEDEIDSYHVGRRIGKGTLIQATFRNAGEPSLPSSFPYFAAVRPIFEQAFLQRVLLVGPTCYLEMNFHLEEATLQPIDASVVIPPKVSGGLPPGSYDIPSIARQPLGAFRLELPWTLTWPSSRPPGYTPPRTFKQRGDG